MVTAVVVASDLAALHRRAGDLGAERDAVVARRDLAVGDTVHADDITVRRVHDGQLPAGALVGRSTATGHVVAVPVLRGNFVTTAQPGVASTVRTRRRRTGRHACDTRDRVGGAAAAPRRGRRHPRELRRPRGDAGTFVVAAGVTVLADATRGRAPAGPGATTRWASPCSSTPTRPSGSPTHR